MIAFSVIPFLHNIINHTLAQWLWYPSFAIFLMLVIVDYIKNKEPTFKTPVFEFLGKWGFANVFPIFISIFVFNYYDIDFIWLWTIFTYVAIYVPLFFFSLLTFDAKNNSRTKDEQQKSSLNICKYIILYWLLDLIYINRKQLAYGNNRFRRIECYYNFFQLRKCVFKWNKIFTLLNRIRFIKRTDFVCLFDFYYSKRFAAKYNINNNRLCICRNIHFDRCCLDI